MYKISKSILTTNNKFIHLYDGLFNYNEKIKIFYLLNNLKYEINGSDRKFTNYPSNQLVSKLNENDLDDVDFFETNAFKFLYNEYKLSLRKCKQLRVNCSNSFEYNIPHTDGDGITIIYYSNLEWNQNWGGHTLFFNDKLEEVEFTSLFCPGRIVVFDSTIPHSISPISFVCNNFRLSLVFQFTNIPSVVQPG